MKVTDKVRRGIPRNAYEQQNPIRDGDVYPLKLPHLRFRNLKGDSSQMKTVTEGGRYLEAIEKAEKVLFG